MSARKVWLAMALAAIVAVAVIAPAYASVGGGGYLTWTSLTGSPHGGYTTATNKCAVCHAVHNASTALGSELLLRSSVADACNYCHVGGAGGYTQVYGGVAANYSGEDFTTAHNFYAAGDDAPGVECANCHQVHAAANLMTPNAYLTTKLLTEPLAADDTDYDTLAGQPQSGDTSDTALTKWCTKCHGVGLMTYSYYNGVDVPGGGTDSFSNMASHVMTIAAASYTSPSGFTGKIAWADSTQCASCHAFGYTTSAWPHYTQGAARFLPIGASVASGTATGATESGDDGVCLRCHVSGTDGVSMTF